MNHIILPRNYLFYINQNSINYEEILSRNVRHNVPSAFSMR